MLGFGQRFAGRQGDDYENSVTGVDAFLRLGAKNTLSVQYRSLSTRIRRARYIANMTAERWAQAVAEHEQILSALEDRDAPRLAGILRKHLRNKFATVKDWLLAQEETGA